MKAWRIHQYGIASLRCDHVPSPQPSERQVLVGIRAASINFRDLSMIKGSLPHKELPLIPLSDGAGEVLAVGPHVTRFSPGDRVVGSFFQGWPDGEITPAKFATGLGGLLDGVLAEEVAFEEDGLVPVPDHLSFEEAATLPCAAVTAWTALIEQGRLAAGQTVLVQGTGGVSTFAIQFAAMAGAHVIVISSSDEKLAKARQLGARELINYSDHPDWDAKVLEVTGGVGVDHVIEVGGAQTFNRSLQSVRMGGTISMIGVLSGVEATVKTALILRKSIRIQGIYVGSRAAFQSMNRAIAAHGLRPVIDSVVPFSQAPAAFSRLEAGRHVGKICIRY